MVQRKKCLLTDINTLFNAKILYKEMTVEIIN